MDRKSLLRASLVILTMVALSLAIPLGKLYSAVDFVAAVGGAGTVPVSGGEGTFAFGVGQQADNSTTGWLWYSAPGLGRLQATSVSSLVVRGSEAGFWGFGLFGGDGLTYSFNVTLRGNTDGQGRFGIGVWNAGTGVLVHRVESQVSSGYVTVQGDSPLPSAPPSPPSVTPTATPTPISPQPTPTPTPTATPVAPAVAPLTLLSGGSCWNPLLSGISCQVVVRFRNDTPYNLSFPSIAVQYIVRYPVFRRLWLHKPLECSGIVAPGQTGYGSVWFYRSDFPVNFRFITNVVEVYGYPTSLTPLAFSFEGVGGYYDQYGVKHVFGRVTNVSASPTLLGNVFVVALRSDDSVVHPANTQSVRCKYFLLERGSELGPGESYSFDVAINWAGRIVWGGASN